VGHDWWVVIAAGSPLVCVEDEDEDADDALDVVVPIEPNQAITLNASRKQATATIATRLRISRTLTACGDMPSGSAARL
jgi:hypothetical protein